MSGTQQSRAASASSVAQDYGRLTALADELGHLTVHDLCLLAGITLTTATAWRKRGKGPAHIQFGNQVLYPRKAVSAYLQELEAARDQRPADVRALL